MLSVFFNSGKPGDPGFHSPQNLNYLAKNFLLFPFFGAFFSFKITYFDDVSRYLLFCLYCFCFCALVEDNKHIFFRFG